MTEGKKLPDRLPAAGRSRKAGRALLSAASSIPFAGGLFSAAAGYWSESEQSKVNQFLQQWLEMLQEELKEKERTILEITARLDMQDDAIQSRISSSEYQSLLKKTFREWSSIDTESKRKLVRNILSNAAAGRIASDDVIKLFLDWMKEYSDMHFEVIGSIYNNSGISRGGIWRQIGRSPVREDSADADLFKLLVRDLSTGGIIRQHREKDYAGNYIKKSRRRGSKGSGTMVSAFDEEEGYELTALGTQFVQYAMNELTLRIEYDPSDA